MFRRRVFPVLKFIIILISIAIFAIIWFQYLYRHVAVQNFITQTNPQNNRKAFKILKKGHHAFTFNLRALILPQSEIVGLVTSSILFNFSPLVNQHVKAMIAAQIRREPWMQMGDVYPFQVSCLPDPRKNVLTCVLRVWFRFGRWQNVGSNAVINRFQDSFFYAVDFDQHLNVIPHSGRLLGIPSATQEFLFTGPEDPRLVFHNGTLLLNFINGYCSSDVRMTIASQYVWSLDDSILHTIRIPEYQGPPRTEKNWTPWVFGDKFRFLYQIAPTLRVLECSFVHSNVDEPHFGDCHLLTPYNDLMSANTTSYMLRGGSPLVHYKENYYAMLTHSVEKNVDEISNVMIGLRYATQLVMLNARDLRVVFVSSPIFVDPNVMLKTPSPEPVVLRPFLYARSLLFENEDSLVFGAGINDYQSLIIRLSGFKALLDKAIENDKQVMSSLMLPSEHWLSRVNGEEIDRLFNGQKPIPI